jgi:hypothetical protein
MCSYPTPAAHLTQRAEILATQTSGTSSDIVTFVDENNLLGFDLPGDWFYEHNAYDKYYVDTFTSPDEVSAKIESLVYNDGKPSLVKITEIRLIFAEHLLQFHRSGR